MSVVVYGFFKAIYLSILNGLYLYVRIWSFSEVYSFGPPPRFIEL